MILVSLLCSVVNTNDAKVCQRQLLELQWFADLPEHTVYFVI